MAQPDYVPLSTADKVRAPERLPVPEAWRPDRPAELKGNSRPTGSKIGTPGPDQGYALKLARHFEGKLTLAPDEHEADASAGCVCVAMKRAALFGRAPVVYDLELAFTLWGYLGDAPADLVAFRTPLFQAASHHYWDQRGIVDRVPEETLRLTPAQVRERMSSWRELVKVD
ncbi:MAG TPA: hypothetical protein VM938_14675 [Acidimicrobiales bacterium]|nr:hypothetical protein [Acidimicrobiales bacterium]